MHAFSSWKFSFVSWLTFGDSRYQAAFTEIEKMNPNDEMKPYNQEERELSTKLFAILTSYLKGRCLSLVKSLSKSRDGFQLWRELHKEFEPSTRQRSLAIAQTLASYPAFPKDKSVLESILAYKQLVPQFEELSGTSYPSELKSATITKCSDAKLREHLQLTIQDTTTYAQLREVVLNYEKASKSWTGEAVLKSIQNTASHDDGGPRPMEVDRVEAKGQNKGKGKGKYGKGWQSFGSSFLNYGRGRGNNFKGRGRGKGKGKSKGKNKGKSKNGGKQTKGKQKGKVDAQQCRICHEYGHWARECPNRVNQVGKFHNRVNNKCRCNLLQPLP